MSTAYHDSSTGVNRSSATRGGPGTAAASRGGQVADTNLGQQWSRKELSMLGEERRTGCARVACASDEQNERSLDRRGWRVA
jgi:hypothetical protein